MSVQIVTFEDIMHAETWEFPCECAWHGESDAAAEWVVVHYERPCGCKGGRVTLWCDPCLKQMLASNDLRVKCGGCGETFRLGDVKITVEPIFREAA